MRFVISNDDREYEKCTVGRLEIKRSMEQATRDVGCRIGISTTSTAGALHEMSEQHRLLSLSYHPSIHPSSDEG